MSHSHFFEVLNNKILKNIVLFFKCYVFSFVLLLLLERDRKRKNYEYDGPGNSIPYKMMFVLATLVKNCGRKFIFSVQSAIFQGSYIVT